VDNTKSIKVMADYGCSPLWLTSPHGSENLPIDRLSISSTLASDLEEWALEYDSTLDQDDPVSSGFSTVEVEGAHEFATHGEQLARRLAAELGNEYTVSYFDDTTGSLRSIS
jgi:hypothetical protein